MGFDFLPLHGGQRAGKRSTRAGKSGTKTKTTLRHDESCAGGLWSADFFGASPRRIGLGHPLGRDPGRTIDTDYWRDPRAAEATTAGGIGRSPARLNPAGKLG